MLFLPFPPSPGWTSREAQVTLLPCLLGISAPLSHTHLESNVESRVLSLLPPQMAAPQSSPSKTEPRSSLTRPCPSAPQDLSYQCSCNFKAYPKSVHPSRLHSHTVSHLEDHMSLLTGLPAPALAPPQCIFHSKPEGLFKANSRSYFSLV